MDLCILLKSVTRLSTLLIIDVRKPLLELYKTYLVEARKNDRTSITRVNKQFNKLDSSRGNGLFDCCIFYNLLYGTGSPEEKEIRIKWDCQ